MTIRHEPTLWCDGIEDDTAPYGVRHAQATETTGPSGMTYYGEDGCPYWVQNGQTAREIRASARRAGWKRVDGRDYSPQCLKLLEAARAAVEADAR